MAERSESPLQTLNVGLMLSKVWGFVSIGGEIQTLTCTLSDSSSGKWPYPSALQTLPVPALRSYNTSIVIQLTALQLPVCITLRVCAHKCQRQGCTKTPEKQGSGSFTLLSHNYVRSDQLRNNELLILLTTGHNIALCSTA